VWWVARLAGVREDDAKGLGDKVGFVKPHYTVFDSVEIV